MRSIYLKKYLKTVFFLVIFLIISSILKIEFGFQASSIIDLIFKIFLTEFILFYFIFKFCLQENENEILLNYFMKTVKRVVKL